MSEPFYTLFNEMKADYEKAYSTELLSVFFPIELFASKLSPFQLLRAFYLTFKPNFTPLEQNLLLQGECLEGETATVTSYKKISMKDAIEIAEQAMPACDQFLLNYKERALKFIMKNKDEENDTVRNLEFGILVNEEEEKEENKISRLVDEFVMVKMLTVVMASFDLCENIHKLVEDSRNLEFTY